MIIEADMREMCDVICDILYDNFDECTKLNGYKIATEILEALISIDKEEPNE